VRSITALLAVLLACLLGGIAKPAAADEAALERRIKAAFVAKFPGYIEWPAGAFTGSDSPILILVAGAEALESELELAVAGRVVGERSLKIQRTAAAGSPPDCHVLVIGRGLERGRTGELLAWSRGKPILTVTENDRGQHPASVINFIEVDRRIRFDISRDAAERNGLRLGGQLLGVAHQVKGSGS
jgi:hypothetical protein